MPTQTRSPFLRSKIQQPRTPAHLVRRPRLLHLLDELTRVPVTLVVAPPGAGKTVLLADWASRAPVRHAWVTLSESDADPRQLWTTVIAALTPLEPEAVERAAPMFRRADALETATTALLDDLHSTDTSPLVLILDNVHVLDLGPAAQESFSEVAQSLPPWLHLVLVGRHATALPVERMQANGTLSVVRFPELRLTTEEAIELMGRLAPGMPGDRLRASVTRADGWPAALQLAALAARTRQAIPVVHGEGPDGERLINEYVWREVLRAESPDVVSVLLDTAVAERLAPGLAETLTGRQDAFDLLLVAEERGLFVTRLEHGGWLQVHLPVREVLLAEAELRSPERVREQHRRAARWFERLGEFPTALDHWLAGDEPGEGLRLLSMSARELYDTGRQATVLQMLPRVRPQAAGTDPTALMQYAFPQLLVNRSGFLDTVDNLRRVLDLSPDVDAQTSQRAQVFAAQAALMTGDWQEAEQQSRAALGDAGPAAMSDPFLRFGWNLVARGVAMTERWDEQNPEVKDLLSQLGGDPDRATAGQGTRALGLALAGRSTDAIRVSAGLRRAAHVTNMMVLRAEIDTAEAIAHFELGDTEAARRQFTRIRSEHVDAAPHAQGLAYLLEVDQALLVGDADSAQSALLTADAWMHELLPSARSWICTRATRVALARGDMVEAQQWADHDPDLYWRHVGRARVLLEQGRRPEALEELASAWPRCVRHDVIRKLLEARALEDREAAVKCASTAIELAAEAGMLATVAAEGPEVVELAEVAAWNVPQAWLDRLRRAAMPPVESDRASGQVERLTDREQDVLRLLPSRLTLREIAAELFVSQNTLKFHLRVIYRKLGVNSRAQAVDVAATMRRRRGE